jgi:TetR/AcrR family transcriptional repressor of nem operon
MPVKGERTQQHILESAQRVFLQKGFAATSITDLMAAAGVTKGSLYFHFDSKEQIGLAVLEKARKSFMAFLDDSLQGDSPGQSLENFFRSACDHHSQAAFVGGCLFGNTALETSDTEPIYSRFVAQVFTEWQEKIAAVITRAQQAGQVRSDISAEELAQFIISVLEGSIMQARLYKDGRPLTEGTNTLRRLLELRV